MYSTLRASIRGTNVLHQALSRCTVRKNKCSLSLCALRPRNAHLTEQETLTDAITITAMIENDDDSTNNTNTSTSTSTCMTLGMIQ
jgi:hypothetical protein